MLAIVGLAAAMGCSGLPSPRSLPRGAHFRGVWDTNWGQLTLRERGKKIMGFYEGFRTGSITGTPEGDVLKFRWTQVGTGQTGRGFWQMSPDGKRLEGRWGYHQDYQNGGRWWAKRSR